MISSRQSAGVTVTHSRAFPQTTEMYRQTTAKRLVDAEIPPKDMENHADERRQLGNEHGSY